MRIAFITDLHLAAAGEKPQGVDVRQNFLKALSQLEYIQPNGLVIGGDFCYDTPDRAVYEWAKEILDALPYPYYVIAGNHDDSVMLAEVFNRTHYLHGSELYYALPLEGRPALFLDSSKGYFSDEQWTWLREFTAALRNNNLLIFMHHPPVPADHQFMDSHYPFRQSEQFLKLMHELPCHVTVICGHYHTGKIVQRDNLLVLLTPSTFVQLRPDTPDMVVGNHRIGVREITLTSKGTTSSVHYL